MDALRFVKSTSKGMNRNLLAQHLAVLLAYALLAVGLTWPAAADPGNYFYNSGQGWFFFPSYEDASQNAWNIWWLRLAFAEGYNPFFTPLLYHPDGVQMLVQTMNFSSALLVLPFVDRFGPVGAYNLAAISGFWLTAYGGFLLARRYSPTFAGPWLAGALLSAAPFHVAKFDSGQLNFVTMQWLVFYAAALVWMSRDRRWWTLLPALIALLLVIFCDWYWAIVAGLLSLAYAGLSLLRAADRFRLLVRYVVFAGLLLLCLLPLVPALLQVAPAASDPAREALWAAYTQGYSSDAFGLAFPNALHPLWAAPVERFLVAVAPFSITEGSYTAAGWTLLLLAGLGAWWYGCEHWDLLLLAGLGWLFSLGPVLYVLGQPTGIAMPYALLSELPLLGTARRPNLFAVIAMLVATIFAALALQRLLAAAPLRRRLLIGGLVSLVALFELWPPQRNAVTFERPALFASLAEQPGVVIDLPVESDVISRSLRHQMLHGRPILRGYVARPPEYPVLNYAPLVNALGRMQFWPEQDIVALDQAAWQRMQCFYRLRHVVLERPLVTAQEHVAAEAAMARLTGSAPQAWYEDERFIAYELPLYAESCGPFAYLGAGWHQLEAGDGQSWRWTSSSAQIWLVNPFDQPLAVRLSLRLEPREAGQQLAIRMNGEQLAQWQPARRQRSYQIPVLLAPGSQVLELQTTAAPDPAAGRELGVSVRQIELVPLRQEP